MDPYEKPVGSSPKSRDMRVLDALVINSGKRSTLIGERERNQSPNRPYIDSLDIESDDPRTLSEKCVDDSQEKLGTIGTLESRKGVTQSSVHPYMELFDGAVADNPISGKRVDDCVEDISGKGGYMPQEGDGSTVHPYIELSDVVEADISDEYKRTSDGEIPSSYITVNF